MTARYGHLAAHGLTIEAAFDAAKATIRRKYGDAEADKLLLLSNDHNGGAGGAAADSANGRAPTDFAAAAAAALRELSDDGGDSGACRPPPPPSPPLFDASDAAVAGVRVGGGAPTTGLLGVSEPTPRALRAPPVPFVGRAAEMQRLLAMWTQVSNDVAHKDMVFSPLTSNRHGRDVDAGAAAERGRAARGRCITRFRLASPFMSYAAERGRAARGARTIKVFFGARAIQAIAATAPLPPPPALPPQPAPPHPGGSLSLHRVCRELSLAVVPPASPGRAARRPLRRRGHGQDCARASGDPSPRALVVTSEWFRHQLLVCHVIVSNRFHRPGDRISARVGGAIGGAIER